MDYLGDKLTVAQTHMTQWMGTVRRSLQEALNLVTTAVAHERSGGEGGTRTPFKRTSSFRHFASRSRESFRRFSVRSQQRFSSLRKRQPSSEPPELVSTFLRPSRGKKSVQTLGFVAAFNLLTKPPSCLLFHVKTAPKHLQIVLSVCLLPAAFFLQHRWMFSFLGVGNGNNVVDFEARL